jgi:hypothetical protein
MFNISKRLSGTKLAGFASMAALFTSIGMSHADTKITTGQSEASVGLDDENQGAPNITTEPALLIELDLPDLPPALVSQPALIVDKQDSSSLQADSVVISSSPDADSKNFLDWLKGLPSISNALGLFGAIGIAYTVYQQLRGKRSQFLRSEIIIQNRGEVHSNLVDEENVGELPIVTRVLLEFYIRKQRGAFKDSNGIVLFPLGVSDNLSSFVSRKHKQMVGGSDADMLATTYTRRKLMVATVLHDSKLSQSVICFLDKDLLQHAKVELDRFNNDSDVFWEAYSARETDFTVNEATEEELRKAIAFITAQSESKDQNMEPIACEVERAFELKSREEQRELAITDLRETFCWNRIQWNISDFKKAQLSEQLVDSGVNRHFMNNIMIDNNLQKQMGLRSADYVNLGHEVAMRELLDILGIDVDLPVDIGLVEDKLVGFPGGKQLVDDSSLIDLSPNVRNDLISAVFAYIDEIAVNKKKKNPDDQGIVCKDRLNELLSTLDKYSDLEGLHKLPLKSAANLFLSTKHINAESLGISVGDIESFNIDDVEKSANLRAALFAWAQSPQSTSRILRVSDLIRSLVPGKDVQHIRHARIHRLKVGTSLLYGGKVWRVAEITDFNKTDKLPIVTKYDGMDEMVKSQNPSLLLTLECAGKTISITDAELKILQATCNMHDLWRKPRSLGAGLYVPRVRPGTNVDIANLNPDEHPMVFADNISALMRSYKHINKFLSEGLNVWSPDNLLALAIQEHSDWMEVNSWSDLPSDFHDLSPYNQEKDMYVVFTALTLTPSVIAAQCTQFPLFDKSNLPRQLELASTMKDESLQLLLERIALNDGVRPVVNTIKPGEELDPNYVWYQIPGEDGIVQEFEQFSGLACVLNKGKSITHYSGKDPLRVYGIHREDFLHLLTRSATMRQEFLYDRNVA